MQIKELQRIQTQSGDTVVELEVGQKIIRLTNSYSIEKTFEELLYVIACRKLTERAG